MMATHNLSEIRAAAERKASTEKEVFAKDTAPVAQVKGFQLVRAEKLKAAAPKFLIRDIIEDDTFAEFFRRSATYKSFMAVEVACCVATGSEFFGRPVTKGMLHISTVRAVAVLGED